MKKYNLPFLSSFSLAFLLTFSPVVTYSANSCALALASGQENSLHFGSKHLQSEILDSNISVFVWNIHKAADANLVKDFHSAAERADITLFQESMASHVFTDRLEEANPSLGWTQAKAFEMSPIFTDLPGYTGVATGSRFEPASEEVLLSLPKEPITNTPKSILISEFKIRDRKETLLVANVHAINFVLLGPYREHIQQLVTRVAAHQGPLIIAGDFNTWSSGRMKFLKEEMAKIGANLVDPPQKGLLKLDHFFIRGLKVHDIHDVSYISSSDHSPMLVDFLLE